MNIQHNAVIKCQCNMIKHELLIMRLSLKFYQFYLERGKEKKKNGRQLIVGRRRKTKPENSYMGKVRNASSMKGICYVY